MPTKVVRASISSHGGSKRHQYDRASARWSNSWFVLLGRLCLVLMAVKTCQHMKTIFAWSDRTYLFKNVSMPWLSTHPKGSPYSELAHFIFIRHLKHLLQLQEPDLSNCLQSHG